MVGDLAINGWCRHRDLPAQIVHAQLIVNHGEQPARIVIEDAGRIAAIHAEDAELLKLVKGGEEPVHLPPPHFVYQNRGAMLSRPAWTISRTDGRLRRESMAPNVPRNAHCVLSTEYSLLACDHPPRGIWPSQQLAEAQQLHQPISRVSPDQQL